MGLPSLMSWASIMATLWSMVVEWSVRSAELPTKVPRAKTAAQRTWGHKQPWVLPSAARGFHFSPQMGALETWTPVSDEQGTLGEQQAQQPQQTEF